MRRIQVALALLGFIAVQSSAGNPQPIPETWNLMIEKPEYTAYSGGQSEMVQEYPPVWNEWHKIQYVKDQPSPDGPYRSRVVYLQFDCGKQHVAVLRDLRYTDKGILVSDVVADPSHLHFLTYDRKIRHTPDESVVVIIGDVNQVDTCNRAD